MNWVTTCARSGDEEGMEQRQSVLQVGCSRVREQSMKRDYVRMTDLFLILFSSFHSTFLVFLCTILKS